MVGRRHRKISLAVTRPVSLIVLLPPAVPLAFLRVDLIKRRVPLGLKTYVVEYKELRLRSDVASIGHSGVSQIGFRLTRDVTRIPVIPLLRNRILNRAQHDQRRHFEKRIQNGRRRIGDNQHVALVDSRPAADRRSINPKSLFERILRQLRNGIRDMVLQTRYIGKPDIHLPRAFGFGKRQNILRTHGNLQRGKISMMTRLA